MAITTVSTFFANRGTVSVDGESLGVVKDVEITTSAEHVPLYGFGSITRKGIARHSGKVGVRIGFAKFKPLTGNWLFKINDPDGSSGNIVPDSTGDTNSVAVFDIIVTFKNELAEVLTATISDVYFPNFPLKAAEGQWIKVDLDGEGTGITFS